MAMWNGKNLPKRHFRQDWEQVKVEIMLRGLRAKIFQNPHTFGDKLLATGDRPIHETNATDKFWGINGKDMLGKLLMQVRRELQEHPILTPVSTEKPEHQGDGNNMPKSHGDKIRLEAK
jgi:hypothetical protein